MTHWSCCWWVDDGFPERALIVEAETWRQAAELGRAALIERDGPPVFSGEGVYCRQVEVA